MLISPCADIKTRMKRFFANTFMACLAAAVMLGATACNDEAHGDQDRERSADNSKDMPGMAKPSEYSRDYDSTAANNRTITPDSNRYIGSQVDTLNNKQQSNQTGK
jgi:negative regulator of sigma E activity